MSHSSRSRSLGPLLALGLGLSALGLLSTGSPAQGDDGPTPECLSYRGEARYRALGYDHVVILDSACERTAGCTVSTDVTPEEHQADVPAGETVEVLTRIGSPGYAFTPRVTCILR